MGALVWTDEDLLITNLESDIISTFPFKADKSPLTIAIKELEWLGFWGPDILKKARNSSVFFNLNTEDKTITISKPVDDDDDEEYILIDGKWILKSATQKSATQEQHKLVLRF